MSSKIYPKRVRFLIADDVRAEGLKPIILGLFADDLVVIPIPPDQPDPSTGGTPVLLQSLAILTAFIGGKGSFKMEVSLYQPDGTAIFENKKVEEGISSPTPTKKGNINFIAKFMPFSIPNFGKYRFVIKLDKKEFTYMFEINRQTQ